MSMPRPPCGPGLMVRVAWWALAMAATMDRPRPRPSPSAGRVAGSRWNGWSSRVTWSAGMTGPVLVIVSEGWSAAGGDLDADAAAGDVVPDRVVDQVGGQALQQAVVAEYGRGADGGADGQPAGGGFWLEGVQDAGGDGGEVEELAVVEAALAAGQGEQRLDELFLLVAGFQHVFAGGPERGQGGVGVGEGHLQQGAGRG